MHMLELGVKNMDFLLGDLLSNKAILFDVVSLLGIAGLILFIYNIRFGNRFLSYFSSGLILICLASCGGIWVLETQYQQLGTPQSTAGRMWQTY